MVRALKAHGKLSAPVERVVLGEGLVVPRLAFGCEPLGGTDWGAVDEAEIRAAIAEAVDRGIDFFDTADVYGLGRSEERLARALGDRRHDVVIATKGGVAWTEVPGGRAITSYDGSARWLRRAVEGSLRRLRLDTIPLYYLHWPDPATPIESSMEVLARCREEGWIRHIGVSNVDAAQLRRARAVAPVDVVQLPYNLLERHIENETLAAARVLGIGVVTYGPLAQGLLTGRYDAGTRFGSDDRRSRLPHFSAASMERGLRVVERLRRVAAARGATPAQVALRWVLDRAGVGSAIAGVKNRRQLLDNIGALGWQLTAAEHTCLTRDDNERRHDEG